MEGGEMLEFLAVAVPAAIAVILVLATVALIFWYGAGRQSSYEDAVKARKGHAERELRKMAEKEKEQQKQKREKKRVGKSKKQDSVHSSGQEDAEATPPPPQKGILKSSRPNSVVKDKVKPPTSVSAVRVDFEVSATPARDGKSLRTNPPTPHPSALRGSIPPLARAMMEDELYVDGEPEVDAAVAPKTEPKKKHRDNEEQQPKSKPKPANPPPPPAVVVVSVPVKAAAGGGSTRSSGQKKTKKPKQAAEPGVIDALPGSRIFDIINSSSLSDEEIQRLIDQLLEMMDANAEWKGASKGIDSVKSLKKANEDLHSRCREAEKTVQTHYSKIKDLRAEIKTEQARRQSSEAQLQTRIGKQSGEITIFKTRISGLEEELKQTRSTQTLKKLEEENGTLTAQMNTLAQTNSTLTGQLSAANKSHQEAQEQLTRLHSELRRAKSAGKSPTGGEGRGGGLERVAELEGRLHQVEEDNASLQTALTGTEGEKDRLVEQVQSLASVTRERDSLTQQLSTAQQQLQEAQVSVQALEQKGSEGEGESLKLRDELQQLTSRNTQLACQVESLEKKSTEASATAEELQVANSQLASQVEALGKQSAGAVASAGEELQRLRAANSQLASQVEALGKQSAGAVASAGEELQRLRAANSQLASQVEALEEKATESVVVVEALQQQQQQAEGPSQEQVEEIKSQLQAAHAEEQRALAAEFEAKRTSEVMGLKAQYEAELQSTKEELARVQREGDEARSSVEQQLASETARKQELQTELETLKTAAQSTQQNGPIELDQIDSHHEEVLRAKEEDLARAEEERDNLKDKLKLAESKLTELQGKNNSLRDNCWKARDDTAKIQTEWEAKLKHAYKESEGRVKVAEVSVREEMEEGQRALLQRLFPDITVEDTSSSAAWTNQFEAKTQLSIEDSKKQLQVLTERVEELEQTEHTYIQEAQGFRETLNSAFGNLAKLQEEVTSESVQHTRLLEERDEMLQRERMTNRDLQEQLSKATANLEEEIKKVRVGGEDRVRQLEGDLEEAAHTKDTLSQEVEQLSLSLDQMKNRADETAGQLEIKCEDLMTRVQETEESLQSTVELGKIGQSIMQQQQIPSDSTEV